MNPALPLLLALSLAGIFVQKGAWRRGPHSGPYWDLGLPWAVCGLAATLLLAPVLAIPDGVPSSAAALGQHVPWRGIEDPALAVALDPELGNPHLRDITQQVQPWLLYLRHELRAGRLPYWNPHQFSGTPFWSNGSSAPLFPFHLLFAALPVQLGLVVLPWLRLVVGGCGAWALARELGTSRAGALAATVAFPLSGMITGFVLFPMANAHALVPWVLLATERLASRRWSWAVLALLGGLQLAAGHPETAVFTGLLTLVYLAVRGGALGTRWGTWLRFAGAWGVALAVSAVHTLPLLFTLVRSSKWLEGAHLPEGVPLPVLGGLLLRFVLPELHGNPALGTWWGPYNYPATAIYAGAATLLLGAAGLAGLYRDRGRDRRWLAVAAATLFAFLVAYQAPGLRHLVSVLPVLQKSLTHYLKFGVELGLALLAARGVDRLRAGEGRRLLMAGAAVVLAALAAAWLGFAGEWREHGLLPTQAAWTAGAAAVAIGLATMGAAASRLPEERRARLILALPVILTADLVLAHARTNPALPAAALYPETGAVRFLEAKTGGGPGLGPEGGSDRLAGVGTALQPNASMVYGLHDVRGDTPVKLHHYQEAYASFASPHPVYFRPIEDWDSPWLDRLAVRWVVAPPGAPSPVRSGRAPWRLAYDGTDARVWERPGALPLVRWREGALPEERPEVMERSPGHWLITWGTRPLPRGATHSEVPPRGATHFVAPRGATPLVVAETWDPGWRATVNGEPAPVERVDGVLLGVRVPPGPGALALTYRPQGIVWGTALTLLGLAACGLGFAVRSGVGIGHLKRSRIPGGRTPARAARSPGCTPPPSGRTRTRRSPPR